MDGPPRLVGRAAELSRLREVVDACRRGERAVAFVGGEAGIGKTRLITELARQAGDAGAQVRIGGCLDLDEGGFPYEPVVEALRGALDGEAFTFQAVQHAVTRLGEQGPVLLVVEDVHWADRSTRDLIAYLASTAPPPPLALVLTYRSDGLGSGHPLRRFVAELERRPTVAHLRLDRLGRADAAALLAETLGRPPDPATTEMVYQRSEGNPFFLQELVRAASTAGNDLPPVLADVLTARVRQLSPPTQEVLRVAAVGGRRVSHERLAAVALVDAGGLAAAVREARDADIITADTKAGRYEFRHALLHEAVYADVLPGERSLYHTRYAELLAASPPRSGIEGWAELAHHWRAAGRADEALGATIEAGMAAETAYALPEAAHYYELALALWPEAGLERSAEGRPDLPLTRLEVLARAADATSRTGAFERAVELTSAAIAEVDPADDPAQAGLLHERRAWFLWRAGDEEQGLAEYREGVRLVPTDPPTAARARVLAAYADALGRLGEFGGSRRNAEEAVAIASSVAARFDEGHARHILGLALAALGEVEAGIEELQRARVLAERNGDIADVAGTYVHLWRVLTEQGRADEMVRIARDAADFCHAAGMELAGRMLDCIAGGFLHLLGRWDEAEERLRVDERELWGLAAVVSPAVRGVLEVDRGDLDSAREHLETARCLGVQIHDGRINGLLYRGLAELAVWEGRPDDALRAVTAGLELSGDDEMQARLCASGLRAAADLAARQRADAAVATVGTDVDDLLGRLDDLDRRAVARRAPPASEVRSAAAMGRAEVSRAAGRSEPDRWSEAEQRWGDLGFPAPAAYCAWRLAQAVQAEGRRAESVPLWQNAFERAGRLGAHVLRETIAADATRAAIPLDRPADEAGTDVAAVPFGLTERELEVLALVAAGRTNREIGADLFISEKTASVHVSRILAKTGARTRAQAAALAVQLGLAGGSK